MKYRQIILSVAAILGLILSGACSKSGNGNSAIVIKGPFHIKVQSNGQLKSSDSLHIGCPSIRRTWNFTISFMAPEGKEVAPGTPILGFDTKQLAEKLALRQSQLQTARKELEKIELVEQEKLDKLHLQAAEAKATTNKAKRKAEQPEEFTALNELKKLRMDYKLAQLKEQLMQKRIDNQISGMKTRINAQKNKITTYDQMVKSYMDEMGRMRVKAPKKGIVVYSPDWNGRKKAVGDRCWMGSAIMELPNLEKMDVAIVIPEPVAGKVKEGLAAEIRLDSNPDRIFKGKVKELGRIFRAKSHEQPAVVFDAKISIDDPDTDSMRPGMAASVDIIINSRKNVLQVPEAAIVYGPKGAHVMKETFTGSKMVPVFIGASSGGMVEILEGLKEDDTVIIPEKGNGENQ